MSLEAIRADLAFLSEKLDSPMDRLLLLRSSFEAALMRLGHDPEEVEQVMDEYYNKALN